MPQWSSYMPAFPCVSNHVTNIFKHLLHGRHYNGGLEHKKSMPPDLWTSIATDNWTKQLPKSHHACPVTEHHQKGDSPESLGTLGWGG
jgi:hypothetical protein